MSSLERVLLHVPAVLEVWDNWVDCCVVEIVDRVKVLTALEEVRTEAAATDADAGTGAAGLGVLLDCRVFALLFFSFAGKSS